MDFRTINIRGLLNIDLYSRKVVGWSMSNRMEAKLVNILANGNLATQAS
ncbi:MAG: hypothetical protein LF888_00375 [Candidatus Megaira endosymbiont of Mesostigma viride]|nr:MAG: hypothetical protein LF888_00375 [Candidatus Megaira endosymbiont of Mesostigma viride]HJK88187.1 hypothetical protein [Candidatus Megaira endosymbiont of Mesostigma viride]